MHLKVAIMIMYLIRVRVSRCSYCVTCDVQAYVVKQLQCVTNVTVL